MDIERLKQRLQQELPGKIAHDKMMSRLKSMPAEVPNDAKPSAVLILLFPMNGEWFVLYIQRAKDGHTHSGQISFPGGKQEPGDADLKITALREAHEEVGILSSEVEVLGQLTSLYIPVSNFNVYPFVAVSENRPEYQLQHTEVARVLEMRIADLLDEKLKNIVHITPTPDRNYVLKVPAYQLPGDAVLWGASAMITSELEMILAEIFIRE